MNFKERWQTKLDDFRSVKIKTYVPEIQHYFEEYDSLIQNNPASIVVLTSEPWRSDCAPMLLDYCIKNCIPFDVINKFFSWKNPKFYFVKESVDIPIKEIDSFNEYLLSDDGPILNTKRVNGDMYPNQVLFDIDLDEVFFQYIIIKYDIKVNSIFERNVINVPLSN